jgi:hypothetical protein
MISLGREIINILLSCLDDATTTALVKIILMGALGNAHLLLEL